MKEDQSIVNEYCQKMLIGIHCRSCGSQFGFFCDVIYEGKNWTIPQADLFRYEKVAQFFTCVNCKSRFGELIGTHSVQLMRPALILLHIS